MPKAIRLHQTGGPDVLQWEEVEVGNPGPGQARKALGATVLGTVGSDEKAALAKAYGCDHAIVYTQEDFAQRVRALTGGAGVPVVYDSVGRSTFAGSLDCLRPFGLLVSFGN